VSEVRLAMMGAADVEAAGALVAEAFRTEPLTCSQFDLEVPRTRHLFARVIASQTAHHLAAGHPALGAYDGPRLVAVALLSKPGRPSGAGTGAWMVLRSFGLLVPLLLRYRWRSLGVLPVVRKPRGVPSPHHTLEILAVDPVYQRRGLARRLLAWAAEIAASDSAARGIYLQTAGERNRAVYERLGYTALEARTRRGITGYHMFRPRQGPVA